MDVFSVLLLCGGLAFFLFGMNTMSDGLEKLAGSKLEVILRKLTSNPFKSMMLGIGVTAVIQSSSAVTVMLVGLVNSGIIALSQSIGVIMGANIGTTVTAWLLSLAGIDSSAVWMKLLKPENFSLALALIGVIFLMIAKKPKLKDIGLILIGFAVLMYGMKLMSTAVEPLKESDSFTSIMTAFQNPFLGVLAGALITAVIQSSSASVGILQAVALTGTISYGAAIPIIMGQNIGTCITAIISSFGVNRSAKRVSVVHLSFNLIGTAVVMALFYGGNAIFGFDFLNDSISPMGIAVAHSIFNIFTTILLIPFTKQLEKLAYRVIKDTDKKSVFTFLDERLLTTPPIAVAQCSTKLSEMSHLAKDTMLNAMSMIGSYNKDAAEQIVSDENVLDEYEDKLGEFLVKLSAKNLTPRESCMISQQLHAIGDFERIGDHAVNLMEVSEELHTKGLAFSEMAMKDIRVLMDALTEILTITDNAFSSADIAEAKKVEPLEQLIDDLTAQIRNKHIDRLIEGSCTIEMGFILSDLLTNCERVSDHCSNIAIMMIDSELSGGIHKHRDLLISAENSADFDALYNEYSQKFNLA